MIYFLISAFLVLIVLLLLVALRWRTLAGREARVILTGGGTGGHVNPALAIAEGIKRKDPDTQFLYVGVHGKAEAVIVRRAGYPIKFVSSEGFPGLRPSFKLARFLVKLMVGMTQSFFILFSFAPRWVIATGGYVSAPIILATLLLRTFRLSPTKVFLHEQNSVPGQLNAFLGRWVDRVLLTFPQTLTFFPKNGVVVGYPIRYSISPRPKEEAMASLSCKIPSDREVVFVFGGSQGARTINRAIVDALRHFLPYHDRIFIIHGTGLSKSEGYDAEADTRKRLEASFSEEEKGLLESFYYRQDYYHNIADVYSVSDLIVCRGGAGSINEISRLGKPSLLIPKANLPGDHQVMNARAMKHAGATEIVFEDTVVESGQVLEKVEGEVLAKKILSLLSDPERMQEMAFKSRGFLRRHSNERILSELYGDRSFNNGTGFHSIPFLPLMNNWRLLATLNSAYEKSCGSFNPLEVIGDEDDLMYYRHRAAGLLSHEIWQDRNLGVKLIGFTQYQEKIPTLLHMLIDRTPTSLIKRLFGGDYNQVGFIRRNIVHALQVMNCLNAEIEKHLLIAADDPYFETRSQVCRTVSHFGPFLAGKEEWFQALRKRIKDKSFEVAIEAAKAMGEIGADGRALEVLMELREDLHWQLRDAALNGIRRLIERGVISPSAEVRSQLATFLLTATDFRPYFSIKETFKTIEKCCRERNSEGPTSVDLRQLPESQVWKR